MLPLIKLILHKTHVHAYRLLYRGNYVGPLANTLSRIKKTQKTSECSLELDFLVEEHYVRSNNIMQYMTIHYKIVHALLTPVTVCTVLLVGRKKLAQEI